MFGEAHKSAADDGKCVRGLNWSVVGSTVQKKVGQLTFTFSRTEFIWKDFVDPLMHLLFFAVWIYFDTVIV